MRVSLATILGHAEEGNYAVIAPDFTSLASAKAMIEVAEEVGAPLILSYSTQFKPIMEVQRYDRFIGIICEEIESASIPICLHLDHAVTLDEIKEAVDVGFCSVMIDASSEVWEINLEKTRQAVEIAKPHGISVESELGQIMYGEGYYKQNQVETLFTDPQKAGEFVSLTDIDALAISIGNVHGAYQGQPQIDFERLKKINHNVKVPLVLHGSSGIGQKNLTLAIELGIRKINLYSEVIHTVHNHLRQALNAQNPDPVKLCLARHTGIKEVLHTYLGFSGSAANLEIRQNVT
jgi:fructose-bisphosphate aldolase class II